MLYKMDSCTGCSACAASCPVNCITMQPNELGFCYPLIDTSTCISCNTCETVCPVLNTIPTQKSVTAYAAKNLNDNSRLTATSGGIFEILATHILAQGGAVFGAAYDETFRVHHIMVEHLEGLALLKGAKYVQSEIENCYYLAKQELERGRSVLFSGTPCQIIGLKNYLGKAYERLLCVDLICHGVPAPAVWQKYINERAVLDNAGNRPQAINLRSKESGWRNYSIHFDYGSHSYISPAQADPYMQGFVHDLYIRKSCHVCICKGLARASDITLGDFWGIEAQYPEMDDGKGTSLVLLHTTKAHNLWQVLSWQVASLQVSPKEAVRFNSMAIQSTPWNPAATEFCRRWENEPIASLIPTLLPPLSKPKLSFASRIKAKIAYILKQAT